jgi:hypothetical protein
MTDKTLPQGESPAEVIERIAPTPQTVNSSYEAPGFAARIDALIEELRVAFPGRTGPQSLANRDVALAVTHLEDAALRLRNAGIT